MKIIFIILTILILPVQLLSQESQINPELGHPFGTILNIKVEIINGEDLPYKSTQYNYLLKVIKVNDKLVNDSVVMYFRDETSELPTNHHELHQYLHGEDTCSICSNLMRELNKDYVGKKFNLVVYESGKFRGIPKGYFKYQPIRQDFGYHFQNYLVVISKEN